MKKVREVLSFARVVSEGHGRYENPCLCEGPAYRRVTSPEPVTDLRSMIGIYRKICTVQTCKGLISQYVPMGAPITITRKDGKIVVFPCFFICNGQDTPYPNLHLALNAIGVSVQKKPIPLPKLDMSNADRALASKRYDPEITQMAIPDHLLAKLKNAGIRTYQQVFQRQEYLLSRIPDLNYSIASKWRLRRTLQYKAA